MHDYIVLLVFFRDPHISEGLSLPTSSHPLSTSPLHHHTVSDDSPHALCRMNFLPDTTTTGRRTPHTALTTLRENILEVSAVIVLQLYLNTSTFAPVIVFNE